MVTIEIMYFYFFLFVIGLIFLHVEVRYGKMGRLVSKIPTPKPLLPIFGNAIILLKADRHTAWNIFRDAFKLFNPIVNFWSVTYPSVLIWDPDDVKTLLTDKVNLNKSSFYKYFHTFAKTGLITAGPEKWTGRRKLINPAFHIDVLKKYLEVANEHSREFIEYMTKLDENTVQNLSSIISKLILTIMTETSMGVHHKFFEESAETYDKLIEAEFEIIAYRTIRPYIPNWLFKFLPLGLEEKKIVDDLNNFANTLILERKNYYENIDNQKENVLDVSDNDFIVLGRKKRFATLDLLLMHRKNGLIDEAGILEEVQTFIAAAHDTTTAALVFNLLLLAENEQVQEKAREEAIKGIDQTGGSLTIDEIKNFEYIDRCLKESLRLFPPVHSLGRYITHDLKLKNHTIPAGADLIVLPFDMHRDPKYWKDPLKFDPDRFLPEEVKKQHPYSYIPFSAGPRNCIGQKLAQTTLKALIAHILYNFKLEPVTRSDEMKFELSVVLKPQNPIYIRFVKINKNY